MMPQFPSDPSPIRQLDAAHHAEGRSEAQRREEDEIQARERIRTKNRRKRYLDLHPEYFNASNLELAGKGEPNPSSLSRYPSLPLFREYLSPMIIPFL